jgi:hypothetical protein
MNKALFYLDILQKLSEKPRLSPKEYKRYNKLADWDNYERLGIVNGREAVYEQKITK